MKSLPKKKPAPMMETFGERAFVGIIPTGIGRMAEKLLSSDIFRNAHCSIVGSKEII
nr:MAG TPA: hypothetical protein [Caudoviricetes sp.]